MTTYFRPSERVRIEIIVINSRFITTIQRTDSVAKARQFIADVRSEMPDANHHVYAFRVGYGNSVTEGMSDDGEPSGTSGPPSLAVVKGTDIGDVALVTTRYFGGTKLGTGGLVRAYTEAAQMAFSQLKTELKAPKTQLGMDLPYSIYEQTKLLVESYDASVDDEIFAGDVTIIATLLQEDVSAFIAELAELSAGKVQPIVLAEYDT